MERGKEGRGQANEGAVEATGLTVEGIEAGLEPVSALRPSPTSVSPGSVPSGTSKELSSAPAWLQRQLGRRLRGVARRVSWASVQCSLLNHAHPGEGTSDNCLRKSSMPPGAGHVYI